MGFLSPPQLKNSSNNENTVKSTAFWLSVWEKWCLEKRIAKEIEKFRVNRLTLCWSDPTPKLKTNMVKPRIPFHRKWFGHRLSNSLNYLAGLRTFLRLKGVKISLYIIFLIVRGCFDRTYGLNKSFLHLTRVLCFYLIMISYLVFFNVYY